MPFAFQMLQKLKEHQRQVFLSSATPIQELRRIVEKKDWRHLFDGIYGAPGTKSTHIISIKKKTVSGVRKYSFVETRSVIRSLPQRWDVISSVSVREIVSFKASQ
jgi:hypothetical protein